MSAPRTPAEMADWLDDRIGLIYALTALGPDAAVECQHIVRYLRAQPTDAQKIEALRLAADAARLGMDVEGDILTCDAEPWRWAYQRYHPSVAAAEAAGHQARLALRLLGLPTGDETR